MTDLGFPSRAVAPWGGDKYKPRWVSYRRGRRRRMKSPMRVLTVVLCSMVVAACGSSNDSADVDTGATAISSEAGHVTLGVNSYLWHASLDTLAFMPLASADPFGGVIITDW